MKIVAISDLHGYLPNIPDCDLLVVAGDICPADDHSFYYQKLWLQTNFINWLRDVPAKNVCFIAGNHDYYFENCHRNSAQFIKFPSNVYYLQDTFVTIDGIKIYGTPWQPIFCDWAFNRNEKDLDTIFQNIPDDTNILIAHGPPRGCGDIIGVCASTFNTDGKGEKLGSKALKKHILRVMPKYVFVGHIHTGSHDPVKLVKKDKQCTIVNVSHLDERYIPTFMPFIVDY